MSHNPHEGSCNPELGELVHQHLLLLGIETPMVEQVQSVNFDYAQESLEVGISAAMESFGLDLNDDSLKDTPHRVSKMFREELFRGLVVAHFPKCTAVDNKFKVDEMVAIKDINTLSTCEHHWQTIHGVTHIAYIPGTKVLGLSKFARIVDYFGRRPQIQERMTEQIYATLSFILDTPDVAVIQDCAHYCMRARGVEDPHSTTITSKMGGRFKSNPALRQEFQHAIAR
jgi:GTP cyclohydrolase IA